MSDRDLRPTIERVTQRLIEHHRKEHRTDPSVNQKLMYRAKAEFLAKRFEIKQGGRQ